MDKIVKISSENGKHILEMSEAMYNDILEYWGIDMKKFAKNFLDIKQKVDRTGKWSVRMTHNFSDGTVEGTVDTIGFEFIKQFGLFDCDED